MPAVLSSADTFCKTNSDTLASTVRSLPAGLKKSTASGGTVMESEWLYSLYGIGVASQPP